MVMPLKLPFEQDIESRAVLKKLARAHQALGELKGVATGMPNQDLLISTLALQEAKDSSAIENIITTHDELYRSDRANRRFSSAAAKEVHNYADALRFGFDRVKLLWSRWRVLMRPSENIEGQVEAGHRKDDNNVLKVMSVQKV
ncbi:Fic/DOC family N-terminal domain-containing protein [Magnetococcales bacterium HHB-1]